MLFESKFLRVGTVKSEKFLMTCPKPEYLLELNFYFKKVEKLEAKLKIYASNEIAHPCLSTCIPFLVK